MLELLEKYSPSHFKDSCLAPEVEIPFVTTDTGTACELTMSLPLDVAYDWELLTTTVTRLVLGIQPTQNKEKSSDVEPSLE